MYAIRSYYAITIRTASVKDDELTVIAGGGIVYDSDPSYNFV